MDLVHRTSEILRFASRIESDDDVAVSVRAAAVVESAEETAALVASPPRGVIVDGREEYAKYGEGIW
jgi:hypothetical protein